MDTLKSILSKIGDEDFIILSTEVSKYKKINTKRFTDGRLRRMTTKIDRLFEELSAVCSEYETKLLIERICNANLQTHSCAIRALKDELFDGYTDEKATAKNEIMTLMKTRISLQTSFDKQMKEINEKLAILKVGKK